jgi:hypothetical protein
MQSSRPQVVRFYNVLKIPLKYEQGYFVRPNSSLTSPLPPALLLHDSACRIAREIWWTNHEDSPVDIISRCFPMLTYHRRPACGRSSGMYSHPIDTIVVVKRILEKSLYRDPKPSILIEMFSNSNFFQYCCTLNFAKLMLRISYYLKWV